MDEQELRQLASRLRSQLPILVADHADHADRTTIDRELKEALDAPPGTTKGSLRKVLRSYPQTREWMRANAPPSEDSERGASDLPGEPTAPLGVYFMCPHEDYDFVRETVAEEVPRCPTHKIELTRVELKRVED